MTTVNADVTAGFSYTLDADNKTLVTPDNLNQLGQPTVAVDLTDSVDTEDIKDDAIGASQIAEDAVGGVALTDSLADEILSVDISGVDAAGANDADIEIQINDAKGEPYAGRALVTLWASISTDYGAANDHTALPKGAMTKGTFVANIATAGNNRVVLFGSDANGEIDFTMTRANPAAAGALYVMAMIGGKIYSSGLITVT